MKLKLWHLILIMCLAPFLFSCGTTNKECNSCRTDSEWQHDSSQTDRVVTQGWIWDDERKQYTNKYVIQDRQDVRDQAIIADYPDRKKKDDYMPGPRRENPTPR